MRERTIGTRSQLANFRTSTERYGSINLQPLSWDGRGRHARGRISRQQ